MSVKFNFKTLEQSFEADWPVTVQVPQDGGTVQAQTFDVRFRLLTKAEEETADKAKEPLEARLRLALVDVKGETFSDALVDALLSKAYIAVGLIRAYGLFATGTPAKN